MLKRILLLCLFLTFVIVVGNSIVFAEFSSSDIQGTWRYHGLISGDSPSQTPGWYWGTYIFDQNGDLTSASPVTDSLGNSYWIPSGMSMPLSSDGTFSIDNPVVVKGTMNDNKDMIVLVATMCPGRDTDVCGYNLQVMTKESGTSFSTSDLQGTWYFHMVTSGDSPQWTGWVYANGNTDSNGNVTFTSITRSDGNSNLPPDSTMAISSDGIVTWLSFDFHGTMNSQKDTIIGVMTDGGGGYNLIILMKESQTSFNAADLEGIWYGHGLTSGDSPQWTGWFYATTTADNAGNFNTTSYLNSAGDTDTSNMGDTTFSITDNGIVTIPAASSFHGIMNLEKDIITLTGDDGGGGYDLIIFVKREQDITPPTVSSAYPANNTVDLAVNTTITATFSEAMDSSTITTTTFSVNDGSTDITGTITYSRTTAMFTPTSDLDYYTNYTATITTGAKDLAGNALQTNYTWSFTTGSASDTTPPTVSSAYPANNTVDLAVNTTITATFSEAMNSSTITTDTFLVSGSGNISGTVTYSGTTATFTPTTNLDYGKTYTATITTGAKDYARNALQTDYTWSFTTQSGSSNGGGDEGGGGCFITTLLEN